jgi:hypothetical protein
MRSVLLMVLVLSSCLPSKEPIDAPFDLPTTVKKNVNDIVEDAVAGKINLSELCAKIRANFGAIAYLDRYTASSIFTKEQKGLAKIVDSSRLQSGESFIVIGLDGDQICYVVCNERDEVIRSGR